MFVCVKFSVLGPDIASVDAAVGPFETVEEATTWLGHRPLTGGTDWIVLPMIPARKVTAEWVETSL